MEQQEEKKTQSKSTSSFPLALILEILLRLPWKSVVRLRCVSKLWSSVTTDPNFTNSFETRSSTRPSLLLCFKEENKLFVFSIPQHHQNSNDRYTSSLSIDRYSHFSPTESVRGLICFQELSKPIVWNPSTRQFLTLPEPEEGWNRITVFLGYDPIEGKHKVVCMPRGVTSNECRVLTLGSGQESWRRILKNYEHRSCHGRHGRCINGVLYYPANIDETDDWVIMRFDVRSEKFSKMELPSEIDMDHVLLTYEGRLAFVDKNTKNNTIITLWIWEDAEEEHKWSSKDFLAPLLHYDPTSGITARLSGITHAGEFIYAPLGFYNSLCVFFYDPVKNSFRKVESSVDDEFLLSNGVGKRRIYELHTFPNHVESLMSL